MRQVDRGGTFNALTAALQLIASSSEVCQKKCFSMFHNKQLLFFQDLAKELDNAVQDLPEPDEDVDYDPVFKIETTMFEHFR